MPEHISKIHNAYESFESVEYFTYVAKIDEVINKEASLNIPLYVKSTNQEIILEPSEAYAEWTKSSDNLKESMNDLFNIL